METAVENISKSGRQHRDLSARFASVEMTKGKADDKGEGGDSRREKMLHGSTSKSGFATSVASAAEGAILDW
jgi:hypothetical protein